MLRGPNTSPRQTLACSGRRRSPLGWGLWKGTVGAFPLKGAWVPLDEVTRGAQTWLAPWFPSGPPGGGGPPSPPSWARWWAPSRQRVVQQGRRGQRTDPGWSHGGETPGSHPRTRMAGACAQPTTQITAAGSLIPAGTASPQGRPARWAYRARMPCFWRRHVLTVLPEKISPVVWKLLSSGGWDFLSAAFAGGVLLLLGQHLWKVPLAEGGPPGLPEPSTAAPSSAAPPPRGWRDAAPDHFAGGRWVRWKLEANDPLGLQGGERARPAEGLGAPCLPCAQAGCPSDGMSVREPCRSQPHKVPLGSFSTKLCHSPSWVEGFPVICAPAISSSSSG